MVIGKPKNIVKYDELEKTSDFFRKESKKLMASRSFPARLSRIGHINKSRGIKMQDADGKLKKIKPMGYEHFK